MIKKYLPITILAAGIILLFVMMAEIQGVRNEGGTIMQLPIILKAVISILLMSIGGAKLLKRL